MAVLLNEADARSELGGLGKTKLYELTSMGEVKSVKIGRRRMWTSDSLLAFVERMSAQDTGLDVPQVLPRPNPDRVRLWRESAGLSREVLAISVGTTAATVAGWESGRSRPNRASVERLAAALGVTVQQLCAEQVAVDA